MKFTTAFKKAVPAFNDHVAITKCDYKALLDLMGSSNNPATELALRARIEKLKKEIKNHKKSIKNAANKVSAIRKK